MKLWNALRHPKAKKVRSSILYGLLAIVGLMIYKRASKDDDPDPLLPDWANNLPNHLAHAFTIGAGVALAGFGVSLLSTQNIQQAPVSEANMAALASTLQGGIVQPAPAAAGQPPTNRTVPNSLIGSMFYMPSGDGGATPDKVVYVTSSPSGSGYNINVVAVDKDGRVVGPLPPNFPQMPLFKSGPMDSQGKYTIVANPAGQSAIDKMFSFGVAAASPNVSPTTQQRSTVIGQSGIRRGAS